MTTPFVPEPYWLIHHEVLLERTSEPIAVRHAYVRANKPKHEIGTRLKWMRKVMHPEKLPAEVLSTQAAYHQAWAARRKARAACDQARAAYHRAGAAYRRAGAARRKAWAAYDRAWTAYEQARAAYVQARAAYAQAVLRNWDKIVALHRQECPGCPFDYQKRTLFP